jgi:PAS domain S-box-containing protein
MSAPVLIAPGRESNDQSGDPAAEAAHLRRLIEGQPSCLIRLDLDGRLLAVNNAALGLLGATLLGEALNRSLPEHISPEHLQRWRDFLARVCSGTSASVECDITDFAGNERAVLLQGMPLLDHPDAVPSMLVAARDISASRHLEQVLVEREVEIEIDAALEEQERIERMQQEAETARMEQERLQALVANYQAERARLVERHAAEQANLRQTLAEEHQLAVLLVERDARLKVEAANKELELARAEQQRLLSLVETADGTRLDLETELARREADTKGFVSDRAAEQFRLHEALAAERERTAVAEREAADLVARLEHERASLLAQIESERAAAIERLELEIAAARAEHQAGFDRQRETLESSGAERERLEAELVAADSARAGLEATLERAREERARLDAELSSREQEWQRRSQESQGQVEALCREIEDSRSRIEESRLQAQNWQRQAEEHHAAVARLNQELSDARQAARTSAEQISSHQLLQGALDEARLECERLRSVLGQQDGERQRLAQVHAAAIDNLRATLVEERELALLTKEREARQRIDDAEAGLARALEERQRLRTVLQDSEVERERLLAEQAAQRLETEHALAAAAMAKERITKAFADQQVELQAVVGNSLVLEAVAGAGRIAREVGRELEAAASSMDRRAQELLHRSTVDAGERGEIEALRVEAVAIASLARQLMQPAVPPEGNERREGRTEG